MKIIYIDTETTGLSPVKNDIISLGYIIEIDGIVKKEGYITMRPYSLENIDKRALEINKFELSQILNFEESTMILNKFTKELETYINKYDKTDKFLIIGYNVNFDIDFIRNWFYKAGNPFFASYFSAGCIDVLQMINILDTLNKIDLSECKNKKLDTMCEFFEIKNNEEFHNALVDIKATKELYLKLIKMF
ncbi:MAG TPA: 3'-5' exonuclease [Clostridia bacterium]|nr:3'-5' exonuclease [Clostridia bacterium]